MSFDHLRSGQFGVLVLTLVLFLVGCDQNTARVDISELRDPLIRKAKAKADQGDREGSLEYLNKALDKRPGLAQSHLDAGLLYDDYKKDYVRAIYHYQRYLELRPDTEKKEMIQDLIRKARLALAAALAEQLPGYSEKLAALQEENTRLKNELRTVRDNLAKRVTGAPVPTTAGASEKSSLSAMNDKPQSMPGSTTGQVYRVQEHETLSMIAAKVYHNPGKWKVIYEANRDKLSSPDKLRLGQALIIP
ncbi:MAG: LysM peptidoglycan-binding domain-containing protein [Verrucomicrobia bacterium]|nr:LysM peptidoglycan-binding domain-containing protein [Verrucomicrobiota bacterium]MBU4292026.1 LysM peptidoglycan-binding domain-containing protein [Verrucomicrobiota bacterium]MBU4427914.1 LysM peptidoglycan-binding domain-containing protein [Verrucomicrobiota bacterium]MCG2678860.1 LysM peptidoglycan-binding domain-containing protein [Kiritimatiellia bacterium]